MTTYRPPGIQFEEETGRRFTALTLHRTGIPGFLGLTQKGPLDVPVRLNSMEAFEHHFGCLGLDTYLETAVRGFFDNGGKECYVVRVAHHRENGPGEAARSATLEIKDRASRRRFLVMAASEGSWGNAIRVSLTRREGRLKTFLTLDAGEGESLLTVRSVAGVARGTAVWVHDDQGGEHRFVREVSGKQVLLDQPLGRAFKSGAPSYLETLEFDLSVRGPEHQEVYRNLTLAPFGENYFGRVVAEKSQLIRMGDLDTSTPLPDGLPDSLESATLAGGEDGILTVTPADFIGGAPRIGEKTGLMAFEELTDVDLLAAPDLMWCLGRSNGFRTIKDLEIIQQEMLSHCERMRDRMAILDVPRSGSVQSAIQWRKMFDSAYGAFYYPWITMYQKGSARMVPPSGFVAGVYARSDQAHGVFHAPANEVIEGAVDLELVLHERDVGTLNREGVNCLRYFPSRGIRIWGARTASSDTSQKFVNVRRELNAIVKSLQQDLQWVVFEPNNPGLWKRVTMDVQFFLYDLWKRGFFRGGSPEEAFFVKCDAENNPREARDSGAVIVDIGVSPVRPAEFVNITITQTLEEQGPGVGV
jgi:hypothetical protein